jgi:hypothetical protein
VYNNKCRHDTRPSNLNGQPHASHVPPISCLHAMPVAESIKISQAQLWISVPAQGRRPVTTPLQGITRWSRPSPRAHALALARTMPSYIATQHRVAFPLRGRPRDSYPAAAAATRASHPHPPPAPTAPTHPPPPPAAPTAIGTPPTGGAAAAPCHSPFERLIEVRAPPVGGASLGHYNMPDSRCLLVTHQQVAALASAQAATMAHRQLLCNTHVQRST